MIVVRSVAVAVCVFALSNVPAFAQVNAGVEAGFSMSRESPDVRGTAIERGPGLLAGAWVSAQPWVPIGIQIEALYTQKHMHLNSSSDLKLDYFQVPVLARLKLFKSIYMLEGIAFGFPVSAKVTHATGSDTDIKSSINSPDIGIIISGGVAVGPRLGLEFRYDGGFTKVSNVAGADTQRLRSLSGILRITL